MIAPNGTDDTAAIQAALDGDGYAELACGDFRVSTLNLTNRTGPMLKGRGLNTRIIPLSASPAVIDCTGASNASLREFRLAGYQAGVKPIVGILGAQMQGSSAADVLKIEGVRVDGNFALAALYVLGVQSSSIYGSQFYNYELNGMVGIFTGSNLWNVRSPFVTVSTANDMRVSDWEITSTEWHHLASGWALWLGAASMLKFRGGNASSSGPIISNNAVNMAGGVVYPENVVLDGMTLYSDFAPAAPYALGGLTTAPYMQVINCKSTVPLR
jgi:hypothetical protein